MSNVVSMITQYAKMTSGATPSTAVSTSGSTVAGATKVGAEHPLTATSTPYSISKAIVAAAAKKQ
jgi:hypothetical protein